jgi:hypothetical protein
MEMTDKPVMTAFSNMPMPTAWPAVSLPVTPEQAFRAAVANPMVARLYANTFTNVMGGTEISVMFGFHGAPIGIVSVSFPVAKLLATKLLEQIAEYENKTKLKIGNVEQLEQALQPKTASK